jgi:hypothetical protein
MATGIASDPSERLAFAPMSAQRLLVFGGIALIIAGMFFGDIFAVFVLHQNAGQTGATLLRAADAAHARDPDAVRQQFARIGGLLEDHGTKVDTHVHMTDAGYLAVLLALVQPYVAFSERRKKRLAAAYIVGGTFLPIGIFLIHYVGLAYSPSQVIGWASVLADSAGALMIAVVAAEAWGIASYWRRRPAAMPSGRVCFDLDSPGSRLLLGGGTLLVLAGFLYGAWYSVADLYRHEAQERRILTSLVDAAAAGQPSGAPDAVNSFGMLQAEKAVNIAAHSHIIEFGLLALLLAFVQQYVFLSERWRRRWVFALLAGSVILPVFVLLELNLGLLAGGIADAGGLLVIVALCGMLAGVVRYTGCSDAEVRL